MAPQEDGVGTPPKPDPMSGDVELGAEGVQLEAESTASSEVRSNAQSVVLVLSVTLMMILNILSGTSINVALVVMGKDLNIPQANLEWPITAYSLSYGCLILVAGRLADILGPRRMFLSGMAFFGLFQIVAGFAKSEISMDVFRALQGCGAAASVPASLAILARAFPATSPYRAIAFACFSAGAPIGSGLGSIVGGTFTQLVSWRGLFYFTGGVTAIPLALAWFVVPKDSLDPNRDRRVDWVGGGLVTFGLVLLTFALSSGQSAPQGWSTSYIIATLVLAVVLLAAFVAWEHLLVHSPRFSRPPLLRLDIFKRGRLAVILVVGFFGWCSFQPILVHATLLFQEYQGLSPMLTMIRFLPTAVCGVLCNVAFALAVPFVPGWMLLGFGAAGTGVSGLLFALLRADASYWAFAFPATSLSVFGADFIYATASIYLASIAEQGEQGLVGGLFATATQIGVAFGLSISSIPLQAVRARYPEDPHEGLFKGLAASQWTAFAFAMAAFLLIVVFCRSIQILGHRRNKKVIDDELSSGYRTSTREGTPVEQEGSKGVGLELEKADALPVLDPSRGDTQR